VIPRNKREKAAVGAGAAAVAVFLVLQLIVFPVMDQKEVLERQQEAYREAAAEMRLLVAEYQGLQAQLVRSRSMIAQKSPGFTLFSFLDQLAGATQIKQFISYMKPSTTVQKETNYKISTVEMKVEGISIEQLIRYLHAVETSENRVDIRRLSLTQTGKEEKRLDAVLEIQTIDIS